MCICCISAAIKRVKNPLTFPITYLKQLLNLAKETKLWSNTSFLHHYIHVSVAPKFHKIWSKIFGSAHITSKTPSAVSWDVWIKATFQACIWLILRYPNQKLSVKMHKDWKGYLEHALKSLSSFFTSTFCYVVGDCYMTRRKIVCPDRLIDLCSVYAPSFSTLSRKGG